MIYPPIMSVLCLFSVVSRWKSSASGLF